MSKLIGHTSVNVNCGVILIFGGLLDGMDHVEYSDEVKVYDIPSESFLPITLSESEKPSPRNFHSACPYENKMIIFGGKSNGYMNDVWQFEFDRQNLVGKWKKLSIVNEQAISPRFGHSAEIYKNSMFIFGGYNSEGIVSNQIFELNLKTFEWKCWTLKNKKNHEILARYFHSSLIYNNFMIISSGKKNGNNPINDILIIDLKNCENQHLICKIKKIPQSISRYGHKSWIQDGRLFMIGGCNEKHDFVTIHSFNLSGGENMNWREEKFHFLSRVFNDSGIGPVFHTLTTYKFHYSSSVMHYFVWGGKYQHANSIFNSIENDGKLRILNEDVLRLILEYLTIKDLCHVQLIGKYCLLSQLSVEDRLWKKFFKMKLENIYPNVHGMNFINLASSLKASRRQFKNHMIEFGKFKTPSIFQFIPKQEILKQDIEILNKRFAGGYPRDFKILVSGATCVGKTTMQIVLYENRFNPILLEYIPTIFESEHPFSIMLNNHSFKIEMTDTPGGSTYELLRCLLFSPEPDLTIIVYSIYDEESFLRVKEKFIVETRLHSPKTPVLLVGSKCDLRNSKEKHKTISYEEGENLGKELNCLSFTEISSHKMEGIQELKELIVKCCLLHDNQEKEDMNLLEEERPSKCLCQ